MIALSAFAVLRHAEHLAVRLGEPMGTVILTLSVTGIEVMMIAAFMYTGNGNASLARDAMFAVVMIILNGMVGLSLLLGGLRYHEQTYNLQGANAFLAVIVPWRSLAWSCRVIRFLLPARLFHPINPSFSSSCRWDCMAYFSRSRISAIVTILWHLAGRAHGTRRSCMNISLRLEDPYRFIRCCSWHTCCLCDPLRTCGDAH